MSEEIKEVNNEPSEELTKESQEKKDEVLNNLLGPNGYKRLILDAEKSARDRKGKISSLQKSIGQLERKIEEIKIQIAEYRGDLRTFEKIKEVLKLVEKDTGLSDLVQIKSIVKETHDLREPVVEEILNPDIKKRKEEGRLCMHRDFKTKKWCNRKLTSADKKAGYDLCKVHRQED